MRDDGESAPPLDFFEHGKRAGTLPQKPAGRKAVAASHLLLEMPSPTTMPALRIKLPNSGETTHHFQGERVTIGRALDNSVHIPHPSVSSHHAEIVQVDGRYSLHDLHSTNRSYVEGKPVAEFDLTDCCKILFGSVECEFDPHAEAPARRTPALPAPPATLPPEITFLENENRDLRDRVHALQRRFDILGSARLITGKSDRTPYGATGDEVRSLSSERDDLRQENGALRLQAERLRDELAVTTRERDAARQAAQSLQSEKAALREELKQSQVRVARLEAGLPLPPAPAAAPAPPVPPPQRPPALTPVAPPPPPAGAKLSEVAPPDAHLLPEQIRVLREVIAQLSAAPAETALLRRASDVVKQVRRNTSPLGNHACRRIARGLHDVIEDLCRHEAAPEPSALRTVRHAAEFLTELLEPKLLETGRNLPRGQILAIDDDADILSTVTTALTGTGLQVTGCSSGEAALAALQDQRFDTIVADIHLPQMDGAAFCTQARELAAYRRTPIIFLTVADTVDKRAETSLSGGNEFIAKPFNVYELALRVESWVLKNQLQLL
jgi:CheY-like chemotaxis protein